MKLRILRATVPVFALAAPLIGVNVFAAVDVVPPTASVNGVASVEPFGPGAAVTARALDGAPAAVHQSRRGVAVDGGRYDSQIDHDAATGRSETLRIDFAEPSDLASFAPSMMSHNERHGLAETGRWTAWTHDGQVIVNAFAGEAGATGHVAVDVDGVVALEITATGYGHDAPLRRAHRNSSDFAIRSIDWTPNSATNTPLPPATTPPAVTTTIAEPTPSSTSPTTTTTAPAVTTQPPTTPTPSTTAPPTPASTVVTPTPTPTTTPATTPTTTAHVHPTTPPDPHSGDRVAVADGAWSDPATWGDMVPMAGDTVTIPTGRTVALDTVTSSLSTVMVHGTVFAEHDATFEITTTGLHVMGGRLEIGTPLEPFVGEGRIRLEAGAADPMCGVAGLCVHHGGTLDLHGDVAGIDSWTQLDGNVTAGANTIRVATAPGWSVGDQISIATSSFTGDQTEIRRVVAIDGSSIQLDQPLEFDHHGSFGNVAGEQIDMRAEVGLLSRSIVIDGDTVDRSAGVSPTGTGGHVMVMSGTTARVEGVEFVGLGQTGQQGRYPFHWHLAEDGFGEYVRNSSIHHSFHRAIVAHGVWGVEVSNNVAVDAWSHMFVSAENGTEWGNRFEANLGMAMRRLDRSDFAFPAAGHSQSSQEETRPGVFWGQNLQNPMIGNRAAGGIGGGNGFLFNSVKFNARQLAGMTFEIQPVVFIDNAAHSFDFPNATNPHYGPLTSGNGLLVRGDSKFAGEVEPAEFVNFDGYKLGVSGAWVESPAHTLRSARFADVASGVVTFSATILDVWVSQTSSNPVGGLTGDGFAIKQGGGATAGGVHVRRSTYGVSPTIERLTVVDAVNAAVVIHRLADPDSGSSITQLEAIGTAPLLWDGDVAKRGGRGWINDIDGSVTGSPATITNLALDGYTWDARISSWVRSL